jgi:hypothetical protein
LYGELADHVFGTEWISGSLKHWHECSCGEKKDETDHSFTKNVNGKMTCDCGYSVSYPSYVNASSDSDVVPTVVAIVGAIIGGAVIIAGVWFFVKKKK